MFPLWGTAPSGGCIWWDSQSVPDTGPSWGTHPYGGCIWWGHPIPQRRHRPLPMQPTQHPTAHDSPQENTVSQPAPRGRPSPADTRASRRTWRQPPRMHAQVAVPPFRRHEKKITHFRRMCVIYRMQISKRYQQSFKVINNPYGQPPSADGSPAACAGSRPSRTVADTTPPWAIPVPSTSSLGQGGRHQASQASRRGGGASEGTPCKNIILI